MSTGRPREGLAFESLEIRRFPGFERRGFELRDLCPGINLIHGPQATGKSSVGRVVERLLWPDGGAWTGRSLAAVVRLDGERWQIEADHGPPRFRKEGAPASGLPVPGGELADRFSLSLHELLQAETDESSFARLVARELAGGFDLDQALGEIGAKERTGRPHNLVQDFEAARRAEETARAEQREVVRDESELDRLREEEEEARQAAQELQEVGRILEWRRLEERAASEEALLMEAFPAAMERVAGDEGETLARLEEELAATEVELDEARETVLQAERELAEADLPEDGVPRAALATLGERHQDLKELEARIAEAEGALAAFRRRRRDAWRSLGELGPGLAPEGGGEPPRPEETLRELSSEAWRPVVALARRAERLRGRRAHLESVEEWLGSGEVPEDLPRLGQSVGRLRRWLRAGPPPTGVAVAGGLAAAIVAGLGAYGALAGEPHLWALAGLGGLLGLWIVWGVARGRRDRASAAREYGELGLEAPEAWRPAAVEERLRDLEERLAEARVAARKAARWGDLKARTVALEEEERRLGQEREVLLRDAGIAPEIVGELDEAPLAYLVQGLAEWRTADAEVSSREAAIEGRRREREALLGAAASELRPYGFAPPEDAAALGGALDALSRREERRSRAREELSRWIGESDREGGGTGGALERLERRAARRRDELEALFRDRDLEPGDRAGLGRLLARLPSYKAQETKTREARGSEKSARARLPDRPDLLERAPEDLEALRAELERSAARRQELSNRIAVIENEVGRAKERHDLEDARARLDEARWALRRERELDGDREVAHELGRWLREQVSGRRRPELMERAGALFGRITRGRYRLLDPVGDPPTLAARETLSDRDRSLGELSSGVRLQLLLAVRVAFIEAQERGVRLPLVMDETLANSDERSSREMIQAVLELARDGRQVFYMTAQEDEVAKWRAALGNTPGDGPDWKVIDLAEVRRLEEADAVPRSGWRPGTPDVPPPDGRSREEYGELLGVPGIDPFDPPGRVHLWHLVEEPEALHRLLEGGVEHWGQVEAPASDGRVVELLGSGEAAEARWRRIRARGRCLEVLLRAWRRGRGRPVDRGVLVASGAVSEAFIDEVSALAEELEGSATALLEALRKRRVKGFYASKMDELEEYLAAEGHLDEREPLDPPGLRKVALRELSVEVEAEDLTSETIDELVSRLPP